MMVLPADSSKLMAKVKSLLRKSRANRYWQLLLTFRSKVFLSKVMKPVEPVMEAYPRERDLSSMGSYLVRSLRKASERASYSDLDLLLTEMAPMFNIEGSSRRELMLRHRGSWYWITRPEDRK